MDVEQLWGERREGRSGAGAGTGLTGFSAADWLRDHHRIHLELADHRRLMALVSYADGDANIDRLIGALRDLCRDHEGADPAPDLEIPPPGELRLEQATVPRDAYLGRTEDVPWREAAGRVSSEMICPYPPGIPIVAPGERLSPEVVDYLEQTVAMGARVRPTRASRPSASLLETAKGRRWRPGLRGDAGVDCSTGAPGRQRQGRMTSMVLLVSSQSARRPFLSGAADRGSANRHRRYP